MEPRVGKGTAKLKQSEDEVRTDQVTEEVNAPPTLLATVETLLRTHGFAAVQDAISSWTTCRYGCPNCGANEKNLLFAGWSKREGRVPPRWYLNLVPVSRCSECGATLPVVLAGDPPNQIGVQP